MQKRICIGLCTRAPREVRSDRCPHGVFLPSRLTRWGTPAPSRGAGFWVPGRAVWGGTAALNAIDLIFSFISFGFKYHLAAKHRG